MREDNENHRICNACFDAKSRKRKGTGEEGGGAGEAKRAKKGKGKDGPRRRLTSDQNLKILKLLEERATRDEITDRYGYSDRTVRQIEANKDSLEKKVSAASKGGMKSLAKARMAMIAAHSAKPVRHADLREYLYIARA